MMIILSGFSIICFFSGWTFFVFLLWPTTLHAWEKLCFLLHLAWKVWMQQCSTIWHHIFGAYCIEWLLSNFMIWLLRWQLLGKDSTDIDIALDNMTGQNFCEKVNEYSKLIGEQQKGIGVIQWYVIFTMVILMSILLLLLLVRGVGWSF